MTRVVKDQGGLSQMFNDDFHTCMFACFLSQEEPKRIDQALKDPSWIKAMQEELLQFKMQKVWVLVDLPHGKRAIARIEAIRLFLAYASFMGFMVYQMDVKSAFLYGTIDEEVYVCQPPGFEDTDHPDKVYKVVKALYGLHQAPKAWYEILANYLLENGFQRGKINQTLFIKKQKRDILLGKQKNDGIFISHDKYVAKILKKLRLTEGKSASTPIDTEKPLLKDPDGKDIDVHIYRSMIGSLMCLTSTRPDIMFTCKKQTVVVTSSTEAEYVAAASCYAQVLWIQNQLLDMTLLLMEKFQLSLKNHLYHLLLHLLHHHNHLKISHKHPRVDTSEDSMMDDDSNQERIIDETNKDDKDEPAEVQEVVDVVTTSKLITKVVTAAKEGNEWLSGILKKNQLHLQSYQQKPNPRIKAKGIMVEEPKPLKKKQQVEMDEEYERKLHAELNKDIDWDVAIYHVKQKAKEDPTKKEQMEEEKSRALQSINETPAQKAAKRRKLNEEVEDLKRHLEIVLDEDDDVYTKATPLATKVPVVDYEIINLNNKPYYKIIRADGTHQLYISFLTLLKNFDREDLEAL
uniref:Reverse transcriptase Ty1/copia-type domain-containing protein n=1 Tax=Tanacetum cinerariifolium TaxID=118510 RepID=A0A6L2LDE6_TANCI|nr:hypothetical protein [Tanacetum cinerariifolium]